MHRLRRKAQLDPSATRHVMHYVPVIDRRNSFGGPYTVAAAMVQYQRLSGITTCLVGSYARGLAPVSHEGAMTVTTHKGVRLLFRNSPSMIFSLRTVWNVGTHPGVAHLHGFREPQTIAILFLRRLLGQVTVLQTHGMCRRDDYSKSEALVLGVATRAAAKVYALTALEMARLREFLSSTSLEILQNSVAPSVNRISRSDPPTIMFCGRLHPRKRVSDFLQAASILSESLPIRCLVVGPDEGDGWRVHNAIDDGLDLKYVPGAHPKDVRRMMATADVLLVTAVDEPFGMTVVEAMAEELPVVLSSGGLELEAEFEARGCVSVSERDPHSLAAAVQDCIENQSLTLARVHAAKVWIDENANVETINSRVLACYDEAIRGGQL